MQRVMKRVLALTTALTIMLSVGAVSLRGLRLPFTKGHTALMILADDWDEGTSRD